MDTIREKISFTLTALAFLLCNLAYGPDAESIAMNTAGHILSMAPFTLGATLLAANIVRRLSDGTWPPWDRIARIYFTIGILTGLFVGLYQYAGGAA